MKYNKILGLVLCIKIKKYRKRMEERIKRKGKFYKHEK